ncbi:chemotaxis protein CheB [Chryseobacterium sp. Leaf404]|uniref:chemotaxis protein CheB n=1 Tax=unclassified Chryseobacterium TaxID=2593645 RepID=UPI0007010DA0|nr:MULTISPECIES: chemotaxis protein CheB [unclassified Chryseobacterium]KQT16927.1 chemotaxis protein CheB [Chryseobacterium sp. Leaf404]
MKKIKHNQRLLVIGGSAGSLTVIMQMLKKIDFSLSFPVVIVVHRKAYSTSVLPVLLQQFTEIEVIEIEDKTDLSANRIYIAPADYHLLFEDTKTVSLDSSEKMNYSRPSIDVTFKSAAEVFGFNLTAALLSGANSDGVEGLKYVKINGGRIWIQNPETAEVDYMPRMALEQIESDVVFSPEDLADIIKEFEYNR